MSPLVPVTLTWPEILKRTFKAAYDDNCLGLAAQLAYYFFLALFPALLFLLAIASLFPFELMQDLMNSLALVAPPDVLSIIRDQLAKIATGDDRGILTASQASAPVIYVVAHQSKIDPAMMLALLPENTLHILDDYSANAAWLEPFRNLARTIVFNAEHVFDTMLEQPGARV